MDDSILNSIKKLLGIASDYDAFDADVVLFINSALMALSQIGVGQIGFTISGTDETWSDFLSSRDDLEAAKNYVYLSTRLVFDPPSSGSVIGSYEKLKEELEWRLKVRSERAIDLADNLGGTNL